MGTGSAVQETDRWPWHPDSSEQEAYKCELQAAWQEEQVESGEVKELGVVPAALQESDVWLLGGARLPSLHAASGQARPGSGTSQSSQ